MKTQVTVTIDYWNKHLNGRQLTKSFFCSLNQQAVFFVVPWWSAMLSTQSYLQVIHHPDIPNRHWMQTLGENKNSEVKTKGSWSYSLCTWLRAGIYKSIRRLKVGVPQTCSCGLGRLPVEVLEAGVLIAAYSPSCSKFRQPYSICDPGVECGWQDRYLEMHWSFRMMPMPLRDS